MMYDMIDSILGLRLVFCLDFVTKYGMVWS